MTRVLYVMPVAQRGGAEVVFLNLVRHLDRARFRPFVVLLEDGPFVQDIRDAGIESSVITSGRVRHAAAGVRAVRAIRRLIRERQIDVVHTFNPKAHIYGGLAAAFAGSACLLHLHGVPRISASRDGLVSAIAAIVPADDVVACSEYVARGYRQAWPWRRDAVVIHNGTGIDVDRFRSLTTGVREEFGIRPDSPLLVMACRLQYGKGVHVAIDALSRIRARHPEVRLLVVGGSLFGLDPGYEQAVRERAREIGVDDLVTFTGFRSDAHRFLSAADVVVHSSVDPDSFPTVILESMMLGRAVVASDCGGPAEMIDDEVTGVLTRPGSVEQLADACVRLIGSSELRERLGAAASQKARTLLTADRMARAFEDLYAAAS
jgi:glycosyltransferase involved in cell wall biosynthesis